MSFAEYEFKVRAVLASGQMGSFSLGARAVPGLFQSPHDFLLAFTVGLVCSSLTKDFYYPYCSISILSTFLRCFSCYCFLHYKVTI